VDLNGCVKFVSLGHGHMLAKQSRKREDNTESSQAKTLEKLIRPKEGIIDSMKKKL
jgi:hypothetical protein